MKYSVGFQLSDGTEEPFSRIVCTYREHISEVFFPWQDIATGRSAAATRHGLTDWSAQKRTEEELLLIKGMGIKLDLLLNGNCYGEYAISEKLANTVISVIETLDTMVNMSGSAVISAVPCAVIVAAAASPKGASVSISAQRSSAILFFIRKFPPLF